MNIDSYTLDTSDHFKIYEFTSIGPKGAIRKLITFQEIDEAGLYNLAFGDKIDGEIDLDDFAITDNGDTEKVLATVVSALYHFFDVYPNAMIYATGSTPSRTRLYRMGITRFHIQAAQDFELYGRINNEFHPFQLNEEYNAFLVQRKLS